MGTVPEYELPDVNRVVISGEVLADPPLRSTKRGVPVTNFTIASTRYEPQEDGPPREEKSYIRIVAWATLAEHCHRLLRKGDSIVIIGELQTASASGTTYLQVNAKWIQFPQGGKRESKDNREHADSVDAMGASGSVVESLHHEQAAASGSGAG